MKLNDLVELTFLDHCTHNGDYNKGPIECKATGRVVVLKKKYVTIASWYLPGQDMDSNTELCTVLRSTIIKTRVLK